MRLALLLLIVVLSACQKPPDLVDADAADLRAAIATTCVQLGIEAPSDRAIADQAGLLVIQTPVERRAAVRAGRVTADQIRAAANTTLDDLARVHGDYLKAPSLLLGLLGRESWDQPQILLVDALTAQVRREARLDPVKKPQP